MERKTRRSLRSLTYTALSAAVLCVISPLSFPIGTIPVTLSLFAVFLISSISSPKISVCAVTVYILIGALGLPVFSGFQGGVQTLIGPTGGFIAGYLPSALLISALSKKGNTVKTALSMMLGLAICYTLGAFWLGHVLESSFLSAITVTVSSCIVPDIIKIFLASLVSIETKKRLNSKEIKND